MSTFVLKIIATVTMFIDHIGSFIPNTSVIFKWIGRISAPIFVFCTVNGFIHTSSKKKYLLRLYIANLFMAIIQVFINTDNNFFRTLFLIAVLIYILEIRKSNKKQFGLYLLIFIIYQIITFIIYFYLVQHSSANTENFIIYFIPALFSSILSEGGVFFILIGVCFYLFLNKPVKLSICFFILVCINTFIVSTHYLTSLVSKISLLVNNITGLEYSDISLFLELVCNFMGYRFIDLGGGNLFTINYQWMMIFALPFILLYNKQKGKSFKYFFYIFYPAHIIILWSISNFILT